MIQRLFFWKKSILHGRILCLVKAEGLCYNKKESCVNLHKCNIAMNKQTDSSLSYLFYLSSCSVEAIDCVIAYNLHDKISTPGSKVDFSSSFFCLNKFGTFGQDCKTLLRLRNRKRNLMSWRINL